MLISRNVVHGEDFRLAKEISLEVEEAVFPGGGKLLTGFHFLGQHAAAPWPVPLDHGGSVGH
jgi:hypothetical protein